MPLAKEETGGQKSGLPFLVHTFLLYYLHMFHFLIPFLRDV